MTTRSSLSSPLTAATDDYTYEMRVQVPLAQIIEAVTDDTVISRGFTGKTLRAVRNEWTQHIEEHPEELAKFPEQMARAVQANALHLGGDESSDVDPDKECYPAGQGVGAMHEIVPAGDLVRRIVDEAEHALARAAATVVG